MSRDGRLPAVDTLEGVEPWPEIGEIVDGQIRVQAARVLGGALLERLPVPQVAKHPLADPRLVDGSARGGSGTATLAQRWSSVHSVSTTGGVVVHTC